MVAFGSGPQRKSDPEQIAALDAGATTLLGTSHRQAPVKHWSLRFVKVCASSSTCLKGMRCACTVRQRVLGDCLRFADHPSRRIRHVWLVQCQVRRVRRERTLP